MIKTVMFAFIVIIIAVIIIITAIIRNKYKMKHKTLEERLESIYEKYVKKMKSDGMSYMIEKGDGSFLWSRETGNLTGDSEYALASITKLYTATVMFNLADEGRVSLDDTIDKYLKDSIIKGLHFYKGNDYSHKITIRHLMSHTSGLPDYYTENSSKYKSISQSFKMDQKYSFEDILDRTKALTPHFIPGKSGKAYYSDFNFDLLKVIIEIITKKTLEENYKQFIYEPLKLKKTYLFKEEMEYNIPPIWVDGKLYSIPNLLASSGASGGLVSSKSDNMIFLKAFMTGKLFNSERFCEMKNYNYLQFFPVQYSMGLMRFSFFGADEIIGHSGSTGTSCYYSPGYDLYITGVVNEQNESKGIRQVCKLIKCFAYEK